MSAAPDPVFTEKKLDLQYLIDLLLGAGILSARDARRAQFNDLPGS